MTFRNLGISVVAAAAILLASASAGAGDGKMALKRLVLSHGVDAREPQEPTSSFKTSDDRVYAFVEIDNPSRIEGQISVVFEPPTGPALADIPLKIGDSARFRTWAFTRQAHAAGEWTVVIRDDHGRVLGRETFTVAP